jgi:hypothetical protein
MPAPHTSTSGLLSQNLSGSTCSPHVRLLFPQGTQFEDINFYKDTFQHVAKFAGKPLRESALSSPSAQASAIAASARALHRNDWSSLRRAWRSLPSLKPICAQRGPHILVVDTAACAQLAQTMLLKVANGRFSRAVAQGAPRPRIESLLAKTKPLLAPQAARHSGRHYFTGWLHHR